MLVLWYMKTASIYDLRNNLSSYINDVAENKSTIIIYRYNKRVAKLASINASFKPRPTTSFFGFMGKKGVKGSVLEDRIRRNPNEKERVNILRTV